MQIDKDKIIEDVMQKFAGAELRESMQRAYSTALEGALEEHESRIKDLEGQLSELVKERGQAYATRQANSTTPGA
jgi:hypothetical protein